MNQQKKCTYVLNFFTGDNDRVDIFPKILKKIEKGHLMTCYQKRFKDREREKRSFSIWLLFTIFTSLTFEELP